MHIRLYKRDWYNFYDSYIWKYDEALIEREVKIILGESGWFNRKDEPLNSI
jgi:hypothetical protein